MQLFHAVVSSAAVAPAPASQRLVDAAHEFEAQMMKELLKPMTSAAIESGDDAADSGSGGVLDEFASEALGRALSERGGLGIAGEIIHNLSSAGFRAQSGKLTGKLQVCTSLGEAE